MPDSGPGARGGFLSQIVDEFGIEWTSIAIFSTLIFSAFNLGSYISTAAWLVGTVVAFSLVFVFRRQISAQFSRVAIVAIPVMIILLVVGGILASQRTSVPVYLAHHKVVASFYLSGIVMLTVAVLLLSYRQQELYLGAPFPPELRQAVREGVLASPIYRRDVDYRILMLSETGQNVVISVELSYTAVNRTSTPQNTVVALTPLRRQTEFFYARIGGRNYDIEDPQYRTEFGLQIPVELGPREQVSVRLSARVTYNIYDSDTFCSWSPATNLELHIGNPFSQSLWIAVESLLNQKAVPEVGADGTVSYRTSTGVLPHQGFRVSWGPKASSQTAGAGSVVP